jgi:hypothetical protein
MLKQILLSIILIAVSAAFLLVNRQDVGAVATSPTASQEVVSAITSFSNNINTISAALIVLETETNTTTITAIATNRFSTESNENSYYQVFFRFTRDTRNNTNQIIIIFIPDVLNGFQAIINNLSPETASSQAQ